MLLSDIIFKLHSSQGLETQTFSSVYSLHKQKIKFYGLHMLGPFSLSLSLSSVHFAPSYFFLVSPSSKIAQHITLIPSYIVYINKYHGFIFRWRRTESWWRNCFSTGIQIGNFYFSLFLQSPFFFSSCK